MCPLCLAASGLYLAGGVSAGAVTFVAVRLLRKRPETTSTEGDDHAASDDEAHDRDA